MVLESRKKEHNSNHSLLKTLLILFISYTTVGLCNNGFFSLLPFISEEFSLSRVQIGYYTAFYFSSAALLAIISGSIINRFGPKKSILGGMGCMGIILFCYGMITSYQTILFLSILSGLGMSILTPSVVIGVSRAAPPEKQAFYLGTVQSGYSVGSIIGPALLPLLAVHFNWRVSIQIAAIITLLIGLLTYFIYQEQKVAKHRNVHNTPDIEILGDTDAIDRRVSLKEGLSDILNNKPLLLVCILGILFGAAEGSTFSHFTVFLTEDMELNKVISGLGFAILYIGGVIGMASLGWISDNLFKNRRKPFLFFINLFAGTMFLVFSFLSHNPQSNILLIMVSTFFLGIAVVGWPGAYFVVVGRLAGEEHAGMATGLSVFFIRTGIFLAPIFFGYIADLNGNYRYSWLFFGLLLILASTLYLIKIKRVQLPAKF